MLASSWMIWFFWASALGALWVAFIFGLYARSLARAGQWDRVAATVVHFRFVPRSVWAGVPESLDIVYQYRQDGVTYYGTMLDLREFISWLVVAAVGAPVKRLREGTSLNVYVRRSDPRFAVISLKHPSLGFLVVLALLVFVGTLALAYFLLADPNTSRWLTAAVGFVFGAVVAWLSWKGSGLRLSSQTLRVPDSQSNPLATDLRTFFKRKRG